MQLLVNEHLLLYDFIFVKIKSFGAVKARSNILYKVLDRVKAEKTTVAVLSANASRTSGAKIWEKRKLQRSKPDNLSFLLRRYAEFLNFKDRILKS